MEELKKEEPLRVDLGCGGNKKPGFKEVDQYSMEGVDVVFDLANKDLKWRATQAPHTDIKWNSNGYSCDFEAIWAYSMRQDLLTRNQEYQNYALSNFKDAAQDIMATLTKRKR